MTVGLGPGEQRHHPHHHVQGPGNHEGELLRGRGDAQKIKLGQYLSFIFELPRKSDDVFSIPSTIFGSHPYSARIRIKVGCMVQLE